MGTPQIPSVDSDTKLFPIGVMRALNAQNFAPRSNRVIVIGDSIDQGGDSEQVARPKRAGSIWSRLAARTRQRFFLVQNVGVNGQSTVMMDSRFATDVVAKNPGIVVIGGGRNDFGSVPTATTQASIASMVAKAKAARIVPVVHTVPPTDNAGNLGTVSANRQATIDHNTWLKSFAADQSIAVIDLWAALANTSTGGYKATYTSDGTHPTDQGVFAAVAAIASNLPSIFHNAAYLVDSNSDASVIMKNPLALGTSASAPPTDWYIANSGAAVMGSANVGRSLALTSASGEEQLAYQFSRDSSFAVGDVLAISGRISKTAGVEASIRLTDANSFQVLAEPISAWVDEFNDAVFYQEYKVESGVTSVAATIRAATTAGTVTVSQMSVRNLTALGF